MDAYLCDVLYDYNFELVSKVLEQLAQMPGLALRADRPAHQETLIKEGLDDPYCDVAIRAGHKDLARSDCGHAGEREWEKGRVGGWECVYARCTGARCAL